MSDSTVTRNSLSSWFWATRPFSLSASFVPIFVGSALATGEVGFSWILFTIVVTASVAIQIGTNLTDEYSDHRKHETSDKFVAPHKVIQRGLLSERSVLVGILIAFGYGITAGLFIVWQTGWPILAIGIAGVAVAYLYAGGPYPLGNYGIGEPVVFVFMGPAMVMGAYYVQSGHFTWICFIASLPVAFIVTAILHCNNLRDIEEDQASGKHSIAGTLGVTPSRWGYATLLTMAYTSIIALCLTNDLGPWVLAGLLPAPWAVSAIKRLFQAETRVEMNRIMLLSAKLHGWTGLTFAAGLSLASI